MTKIELREYQKKALFYIEKYLKSTSAAKKPGIVVSPTGTGKSILIAFTVDLIPPDKTVVVLQPSKELLEQNFRKYHALGRFATVYSASVGIKRVSRVTYATLGSVVNVERLKNADYVIIDECDVYPADGRLEKFLGTKPSCQMIGFTATPWRMHSSQMDGVHPVMLNYSKKSPFGQFIYVVQIQDIFREYWTPLVYECYKFNRGKLVLKSTGLDYTEESMRKALAPQLSVIAGYVDALNRDKIVVFVPDIDSAHKFLEMLKVKKGFVVSCHTPKNDRERYIEQWRRGYYEVGINVNVLSVGFDFPEINAVISARPTNSLRMLYQQLGRGTRPHPSKENCLIADFVDNVDFLGKIEDINFKYIENSGWNLYVGKRRFTGARAKIAEENMIALNPDFVDLRLDFGKWKGAHLTRIYQADKGYLKWILKECNDKKYLQYNIKLLFNANNERV